jgi:hypothetical protein
MDDKPSPLVNLIGWASMFAAFAAYRNYEDSHPVIQTPVAPLAPVSQRGWKIEKGRYGQLRCVPTYEDFELRPPDAPPDRWDGYRWQYRR